MTKEEKQIPDFRNIAIVAVVIAQPLALILLWYIDREYLILSLKRFFNLIKSHAGKN